MATARPAEDDATYTFDAFDDGSSKMVAERQVEKMQKFVKEYSAKMNEIEEALDESLSEVWDPLADPIALILEPHEQTSVLELCKTDNRLFNKLMITFASLVAEVQRLKKHAVEKIYPPFVLFGELYGLASEGDVQLQIGRMLDFLNDFTKFVARSYLVVQNIIRQLASLYHATSKLWTNSFRNIHLTTVFEALGDILVVMTSLDHVIGQSEAFKQGWAMYKRSDITRPSNLVFARMIKNVKLETAKYGVEEERLFQFEKLLLTVEGHFEGYIYSNCISQEFDFPGLVDVKSNQVFQKEFFFNINAILEKFAPVQEATELIGSEALMGLISLTAMYLTTFREVPEKNWFRTVWDMHKRFPLVHIVGRVVWLPTRFLETTVGHLVKALVLPNQVPTFVKEYIKKLDAQFQESVNVLYLKTSVWMIRAESNLANRADLTEILNYRIRLIRQGLSLAMQVSDLFRSSIYLHSTFDIVLQKKSIRAHCQCVELLKAIQFTFHRRSAMIGESISYMTQQSSYYLQRAFLPIKHRLDKEKKYSEAKLDVLASVALGMAMLNGAPSPNRRLLLRLATHVTFQSSLMKPAETQEILYHLHNLELLAEFQRSVAEVCNCSFFFWSRELVPVYFDDIFRNPDQAQRLKYIFAALRDILPVFKKALHIDGARLVEDFTEEVWKQLKQCIIDPLCRDIDRDLREHIHSELKVTERDPFKLGVRDLSPFLRLRPLRLFTKTADIRELVTHYLDREFYNLNTVALYDWKTYAEMKNLAKEKYGLSLTEVHLPAATQEQGLDVLQIMRGIHIFVSRYNYNLNNQIFIERSADSKSLNTISIQHVSNSVRTHGTGIMNTTVNFTFQFLRQKFFIFSQFLFDDHIKARLYKDVRFFKESKDKLLQQWPFERAERFNREIRKLGLTPQGLTYLDQFRLLVTEIGNAMAYIRLIRSGAMNFVANAIKFVPDLQDIPTFEHLVAEEGMSTETVSAARILDTVVEQLSRTFAEGTEYFEMLVNVFAGEFRGAQNAHLKTFHAILPPLTINFIEHMLAAKEKLAKKNAKDALFFCDDGFALGVAYILKLLDQNKDFDSLRWFDSVSKHYAEQMNKASIQARTSEKKEEQQSGILTQNKLRNYINEFELLRFSFSGARIFFRDDDAAKKALADKEARERREREAQEAPAAAAPGADPNNGNGAAGGPPPPPVSGGGPPPPPPPPPPPRA